MDAFYSQLFNISKSFFNLQISRRKIIDNIEQINFIYIIIINISDRFRRCVVRVVNYWAKYFRSKMLIAQSLVSRKLEKIIVFK